MPVKLTTSYQGSACPDGTQTNTFSSKEIHQISDENPG